MPSTNYNNYTPGDEFNFQKDPYRFMNKREGIRKAAPSAYSGVEKDYNQMNPEEQKQIQRKLKSMQKTSPDLHKALAAKKPSAIVGLAGNLFRQIDWSRDWMFILLGSFGLLKDLFDIVFAAAGAGSSWLNIIPVVGQIANVSMIAIGITISFVGDLMFLCLVVVTLVLVGSSLKNRGVAKYFIGTAMEFIAEALPGISWLPWTVVYVLILYIFVLFDRAYQQQAAESENKNIPAYADNYNERLAA